MVTFVSTLLLSVPVAVAVGVGLSVVDERLAVQLRRAGKLDVDHAVHLVPALDVFGASTLQAIEHASAWLGRSRRNEDSGPAPTGR